MSDFTTIANLEQTTSPQIPADANILRQADRAGGRTLLIVDSTVADRDILLSGLADTVEVIVTEPSSLAELATQIGAKAPVADLHILTHGEPGALTLGGNRIDEALLQKSGPIAEAFSGLLGAGSKLALWACSVAGKSVGQTFVEALGALTGAKVFASSQPVGAAADGGTWHIGTASPFSGRSMALYPHTLPASDEDFDGITAQIVSNTDHFNNDSATDWNFTQGTDAQIAIAGNANGGTFTNGLSNDGAGDRIIFLNYNGLTSNNTVFGFTQSDGDHFRLNSFELGNNLAGYSTSVTISILNNNTVVGTATIDLNTTSTANGITYTYGGDSSGGSARPYGTLTFDASFGNVDEIQLVYAGAATPIIDNIDVGAVNSAPVIGVIPSDLTVIEDTQSDLDLSTLDLSDANDDELTVTLSIDAGTFISVADGSGDGVDETLVSSTEITLVGTQAEIEAYLATASNIQYTGASNSAGDNVATLTVNVDDQTDSVSDTVNIDITAVNDLPTSTGGSVSGSAGQAKSFTSADFNFADVDTGDTLQSVRIDTLPASGTLKLSGVAVSAGDVIAVGDIGNLTYTSSSSGSSSFTFSVNDGTAFAASPATMSISTASNNHAPTQPQLSSSTVSENMAGAEIGTLTSTDPEGTTVTFSLSDNRFEVVDGMLKLKAGIALDYETEETVSLTVTATDATGLRHIRDFTITVTDINEQAGTDGDDTLTGSTGQDFLVGGQGHDNVAGGSGNDLVYAGQGDEGNDTVSGDDGDDTLGGGAGDDNVDGGTGDDLLWGRTGNDTLAGGDGNDLIYNGDGSDVVDGGAGNDTLWGSAGDDMLTGGAGADTFIFGKTTGNDTITDFTVAEDVLDLTYATTDFASIADVQAASSSATQDGQSGLLIDLGGGTSVFLVGLATSDIGSMDITI